MLERAAPRRRVLIGDFGVVARMGLQRLVVGEGLEVLGPAEQRREIIPRLSEVQPDVVVLDLDSEDAPEFAAALKSWEAGSVSTLASARPSRRGCQRHNGHSIRECSSLGTILLFGGGSRRRGRRWPGTPS
jgi:CheY-like chemotaxis protein